MICSFINLRKFWRKKLKHMTIQFGKFKSISPTTINIILPMETLKSCHWASKNIKEAELKSVTAKIYDLHAYDDSYI